jgi:5-(carboxyamino)imidazole ribonucleotide mutase
MQKSPLVGVVMGSKSDFPVLEECVALLREFEIPFEAKVVSAHRTPDRLYRYAEEAEGRGLRVIIAAAGGAAHLPGMLAAKTLVPVLGVPVPATMLQGIDSLLSIVQMPKGWRSARPEAQMQRCWRRRSLRVPMKRCAENCVRGARPGRRK